MASVSPPRLAPYCSDERKGSEPEDRLASQRQALEEMSQQLLAKLNEMVKEQEVRAREFAERVHSVSSLPQQGYWQVNAPRSDKPFAPPSPEFEKGEPSPKRKPTAEQMPTRLTSVASDVRRRVSPISQKTREWLEGGRENDAQKADNRGCIFFAIVLFIIYATFKSCAE